LRAAYADPPYIGQAKKLYSCEEVCHKALIERLCEYDCWALSCSSPTLREILPICPPTARVGAWVKPFAIFKPNVNPAYAWEPVIFDGARRGDRKRKTVRDWVSCNITLKKGLCGAKPEGFCIWLIELLGLEPTDTLDDLFPGTGIVRREWEKFQAKSTEPSAHLTRRTA
jgi:hypothetical protein